MVLDAADLPWQLHQKSMSRLMTFTLKRFGASAPSILSAVRCITMWHQQRRQPMDSRAKRRLQWDRPAAMAVGAGISECMGWNREVFLNDTLRKGTTCPVIMTRSPASCAAQGSTYSAWRADVLEACCGQRQTPISRSANSP